MEEVVTQREGGAHERMVSCALLYVISGAENWGREAVTLAKHLERQNAERQALDQRTLDEALEELDASFDPARDIGVVLAREGWHPGVIGIVASRVVERIARPTFLVALDGEVGKGSGRSVPRCNLHEALVRCAAHLEKWATSSSGCCARSSRPGWETRALSSASRTSR